MIEIGLNRITKNYGFKNILRGASLEVMTGQRAAIVGANGTGKTTLLKLIAGEEAPDGGGVSLRRGAAVGMLDQIPRLREPGKTVRQVLAEPFAPLLALEGALRRLEAEMSSAQGDLDRLFAQYAAVQEEYSAAGGYEMEERTAKAVQGFRLAGLMDREYNVLSGGQKTVVNLAAAVLRQPDILLLDEPTNHLDMEALEWFEDFLRKYRGTVLMVSHDRWFLDRVATHIIVLEGGQCQVFSGGYTQAMEERERLLMEEFERYKTQQKKIEAMEAAVKRFRQWGAEGDNKKFFRKAKELEKRLAKMEELDRPQLEKPGISLSFSGARTGHEVLAVKGFCLGFGPQVLFDGAELTLYERDRLCLLGANGSGKTSFLRAVLGELDGYGGEVKRNPGVQLGYIPQEVRFAPPTATVLDIFRRECPVAEGQARGLLAKYYFTGESVYKRADSLSGGEKVLLMLAVLVQRQVNLLILDEPTNHIDIENREILEEALLDYTGTVLFVSHDRYFTGKLATRVAELAEGKIACFEGDYRAYLEWKAGAAPKPSANG